MSQSQNPNRQKALMSFCVVVTAAYLVYRGIYTLNLDSGYAITASWILYIAELWGGMSLMLFFLQVWNPEESPEQPPLEDVTVDVFVPSYNEEVGILRGTLQACLAMDYPHRTYLLDDGNRSEMRQLCEELGVHYITRDNNLHAKAGNLNNAFDQTSGEFVAILDADHIPEPNFLSRMIGYFRDPQLGFVQSPHAFSNFDTFQGSVNYEKGRFWDEGQLFYKVIQPARNYTDSVIFAGSAALFRREALKDVGYIATETITEDMHTGLRMSGKGWKTKYVNERLIAGQGASDVTTFHGQRLRWAEGNLSILFYDNPLTMKGLSLSQRLTYFASIINWASGIPRLAIYLTPVLMLLTGIAPVSDFTWTLAVVFLTYIFTMIVTLRSVFRGYMNYIMVEFFNMANFWTQIRATFRALVFRRRSKFVVTSKVGPQGSTLPHILPQILLLALCLFAMAYGWTRHLMFDSGLDLIGMGITTALVLHHCYFAILYLRAAMTPSSKRAAFRHRLNVPLKYSFASGDGEPVEGLGVTMDLNELGVSFVSYDNLPTNEPGKIQVMINGDSLENQGIIRYAAHRSGKSQSEDMALYRYGLEFVDSSPETVDAASRMVQRYAVAMWYSLFERDSVGRSPMLSRRGVGRAPFKVPVRLETPGGEIYSTTRDVSTEAMRCIIASPIDEDGLDIRAEVFTPLGSIFAQVRVTESRDVTGPPHKVREFVMTFVSFEEQGRSMLQSLIEMADEPNVRDDLSLLHQGRHKPLIRPLAAASVVLVAISPGAIGVFKHVHDDDLALVSSSYQNSAGVLDSDLERILEESLVSNSGDVRRLLLLKDALDKDQRFEDLVRVCQLIVARRPNDPDMAKALVSALTSSKRFRESSAVSIAWVNKMIDEGRDEEARNFEILAARNTLLSGNEFEGLEAFRKLFIVSPKDSSLRSEYLGLLIESGQAEEALRQFSQLPQSPGNLRHKISIYSALGNFGKAEEALQELIRSKPNDKELRIELGNLLVWQDKFDKAIEVFRELRLDHPGDLDVVLSLGEVLAWSGSGDEPLKLFGKLMDDGVKSERLIAGFLDSYLGAANPGTSDDHRVFLMLKRHQHGEDLSSNIAGRLASALVRAKFGDEGIGLLQAVLEKVPGDRNIRLRLADALVAAGRHTEAHHHYRALLAEAQNDR